MAYYLQLNGQKTFIHIPKTGGCWVERFLDALDNVDGHSSTVNANAERDARHFRIAVADFTSVRHPVTWYESVWRYGMRHVLVNHVRHPLRPLTGCWSTSFNQFVRNVLIDEPAFVTRLYEAFIGPEWDQSVTVIARQESLRRDMESIVRAWGYEGPMPSVDPVNASTHPRPDWDKGLMREVENMEIAAIRRFYG